MATTPEPLNVEALAATYNRERVLNVEALIATYDHIRRNPREWNQMVWQCGTSHCYAGHVGTWLYGMRMDEQDCVYLNEEALADLIKYEIPDEFMTPRGRKLDDDVHVSDFAGAVLGLTGDECDDLFNGANTLADIREFIEKLNGITIVPRG